MYRNDFSLHLHRISINPCILDVLRNLTNIERDKASNVIQLLTLDIGRLAITMTFV